jgi:hypothetical protein
LGEKCCSGTQTSSKPSASARLRAGELLADGARGILPRRALEDVVRPEAHELSLASSPGAALPRGVLSSMKSVLPGDGDTLRLDPATSLARKSVVPSVGTVGVRMLGGRVQA